MSKVGFIGTLRGMSFAQSERIKWWLYNHKPAMTELLCTNGVGAAVQMQQIVLESSNCTVRMFPALLNNFERKPALFLDRYKVMQQATVQRCDKEIIRQSDIMIFAVDKSRDLAMQRGKCLQTNKPMLVVDEIGSLAYVFNHNEGT